MTGADLLRSHTKIQEKIAEVSLTRDRLDSYARKWHEFEMVDEAMHKVMGKLYAEREAVEARLAALREED